MSTNYPGALDDTTVLKNNSVDATPTATTHEVLHNNLSDALIAVETALGIQPKGSYADVVTRLNDGVYKTPSVAQVINPSADVVGLTLKQSSGSYTSNFFEIRNSLNNTLAYIDHTGLLSAQAISVAGVPLSSANLSDVAAIAFLAGPAFTGNPTATTQTAGNNSTRLATTAFVTAAIAAASPAVASVYGRTGAVVAANGDYTDAQVTNSATNILTTTGDILYASAANTLHRLAIGTVGQKLTIVAGVPAWRSGTAQRTVGTPTMSGATGGGGVTIMAGFGFTFVPVSSGDVVISMTYQGTGRPGGTGLRYGTGTPPAYNAAVTGTNPCVPSTYTTSFSGTTIQGHATGLTVGTTYWVDAVCADDGQGTSQVTNALLVVTEA